MPNAPSLVVIANPAAGRGRGARLIPLVARALASRSPTVSYVLHRTTYAGEETALAREAAESGTATILALGGDGTWGNVARGIIASGQSPRLALLAAGTGNDLAYASGLPAHDLDATLAIALGVGARAIDVGEADGVYFVNCAGFGFDAEVLHATQSVRWLRGHAVYLVTAARKLFGYRGFRADVLYDDEAQTGAPDASRHHLEVVVSNGPRFGGGFVIAPGARIDDGAFDVIRIQDGSPWRRALIFASAIRGSHLGAPEVARRLARAITLVFDAPPWFEADGEIHQARGVTVHIRCLPLALRLAIPELATTDPRHRASPASGA